MPVGAIRSARRPLRHLEPGHAAVAVGDLLAGSDRAAGDQLGTSVGDGHAYMARLSHTSLPLVTTSNIYTKLDIGGPGARMRLSHLVTEASPAE